MNLESQNKSYSELASHWFISSVLVHLCLVFLVSRVSTQPKVVSKINTFSVELIQKTTVFDKPTKKPEAKTENTLARNSVDFRPEHIRNLKHFLAASQVSAPKVSESTRAEWSVNAKSSSEILNTPVKESSAFDHLALLINSHLDFPMILIENGVQGTASLDLYFDSDGEVDESLSKFLGSNRSLRGLLVRASRQGLQNWYRGDGSRLAKSQFQNQHFHADFEISYALDGNSRLDKLGDGSYRLLRRHYASVCASPLGLDLVCLTAKGVGAIKNILSDSSLQKLHTLQDLLEYYDDLELNGIRKIIQEG